MSLAQDVIDLLEELLRINEGDLVKSRPVERGGFPHGYLAVGPVIEVVRRKDNSLYVVRGIDGAELTFEREELTRISLLEVMALSAFDPGDPKLHEAARG